MARRIGMAALAVLSLAACSPDGIGGELVANQPPTVWLSAAPPEGSTGQYTVQLFWGGWDPDGEISHYEYFVTDNTTGVFEPADTVDAHWRPVYANDSTFTFSADRLVNPGTTKQVAEFERSHTFFVRAVDTQGMRSRDPAYRSFTARTLSPSVAIRVPVRNNFTPADLPPISTFRWEATDYISDLLTPQEPDSVQYALVSIAPFGNDYLRTINYLRTPLAADEWKPWVYYRAPQDSGKFWTTPPTDFGGYVFAIRAKDEAGAVTPVLDEITNVRRVRVARRTTGPIFTLRNLYLGQVVTSSCSSPLTILDIPAGVPLEFSLSAVAEHYGGTVSGYRYGWDITDLTDPEQWEVDFTPFVGSQVTTPGRRFFFGTHTFTAEVTDNSGFCARIEIKVNIVQFTHERNLLVVDDFKADEGANAGWDHPLGRGSLPNDQQHDSFWAEMASGVDGFDPLRDVVATRSGSGVPITTLASYKSIVWSVFSDVGQRTDYPALYSYIQYRSTNPAPGSSSSGKVVPNILALTMAAGGHIMITGAHPVQNVLNRGYTTGARMPFIFRYEFEGGQISAPDISRPTGDQSFAYKELCLETLDFAYTTNQRRRAQQQYCPITFVRRPDANSQRDDTMREALPIDARFPLLQLRPEVSATGKFYEPSVRGLDVEVYNPAYFVSLCRYVVGPRACFEPIYGVGCNDTAEPTYNQPVAFFTSAFADRVADAPGAIGARSVVLGFPPVFFEPAAMKLALETVFFDEWKLARAAR